MTGEPLLPQNRPELYEQVRVFYLESQGNGNVGLVDYTPPTEAELAEADRQRRIEAVRDEFAAQVVDQGLSVAEILNRIKGDPVVVPELEEDVPEPDEPAFPRDLGGGWWRLSDGTKIQHAKTDYELVVKAEEEAVARVERIQAIEATPEY